MAENGPWNSSVTQQFIRPLVDNLITVLQAGEGTVHAEVNGNQPMMPYSSWRRSKWIPVLETAHLWNSWYPSCSVIPRRTRTSKGEGGPIVDESHVLEILIEDIDTGQGPDALADSVMKRIQAAHIIIERASLVDLFKGYPQKQRPHWDIEHSYMPFFSDKKSIYKQDGSLIIEFTGLMERT